VGLNCQKKNPLCAASKGEREEEQDEESKRNGKETAYLFVCICSSILGNTHPQKIMSIFP
jgi:hypothetical protein